MRWIWIVPLIVLPLTALLCAVLSRRVPTRRLGYVAAGAIGLALIATVMGRVSQGLPAVLGDRMWLAAYGVAPDPVASAQLSLRIDSLGWLVALVALVGMGLGVLFLAQSLAASLRGYGLLWTALLLLTTGVLIGVWAADLLLLVFGWGITIAGTALARRVVGGAEDRPPLPLSTLALAGWALLAAVVSLAVRPADPSSGTYALSDIAATISLVSFVPLVLATLIGLGLPPFARVFTDDEGGPPALHAMLISVGLPLLASYTLLRIFGATLGAWSSGWLRVLTVLGVFGWLAGSAGAVRATRFGPLLGWQASAQWGLMLAVLGLYNPARPLIDAFNGTILTIVVALVLTTVWTTLTAGLALGALERRTGSDQIDRQGGLAAPLRVGGLVYACAGLSAIGVPPLVGFWSRRVLFATIADQAVWLMPLVLAGSVVLAVSYIAPLAVFWRMNWSQAAPDPVLDGTPSVPLLVLCAVPLLIFGVVPLWLAQRLILPAATEILPIDADFNGFATLRLHVVWYAGFGLAALALIIGALRIPARSRTPGWTGGEPLDATDTTPHAPQALGYSLRGLATLADPRSGLEWLSHGLQWLSAGLAWGLQLFSGRYYLTGILVAALTLLLLLVQ